MPPTRPIFLTNTLGHKLEEFRPIEAGRVRIYTCGPTVYNYAHIGNFRSFIFADTLRRMLEYNGYQVTHVRNITDVGHLTNETLNTGLDRIEKRALEENSTPYDIAQFYTEAFLRDADLLNLKRPHFMPRASEYVEPMIEMTQELIDLEYGYVADGDVYFDVSRFPRYGQLSGNTVSDLVAGARVEVGQGKRSPADFALWRAAGPDRLMRWPSPWGEGVPGWHLECSAMSRQLLGEEIDIHTGGVDNVFPHHEDEMAQSEAISGKDFAHYWLHSEWLRLGGTEKMSKSLGNVYTLSDLMAAGFHPLAYRYFMFQAHYRTPLNFSWEALEAAQITLFRLWEAVAELVQASVPGEIGETAAKLQSRFREALNRDLDVSAAVAVLHELVGSRLPAGDKLALVQDFDRVLGLELMRMGEELSLTTEQQLVLLDERAVSRRAKDWTRSDALRAELAGTGLEVKDTASGQRWVRRDLLPSYSGRQTENTPEGEPQGDAGERANA